MGKKRVYEKNSIAALLFGIVAILQLLSIINFFSFYAILFMVSALLLAFCTYKEKKDKLFVFAMALYTVSTAGMLCYMLFRAPFNSILFRYYIGYFLMYVGMFCGLIMVICLVTDFIACQPNHIPIIKISAVVLYVIGALFNRFGFQFIISAFTCAGLWFMLDWLENTEFYGVGSKTITLPDGLSHYIDKTVESVKGITDNPNTTGNVQSNQTITSNYKIEELKNFKKLLDEGLITQEDYDNKKKELLGL